MRAVVTTLFIAVIFAPKAFADIRCSVQIRTQNLGVTLQASEGIFTRAILEDGGSPQKAACETDDKLFIIPNVYTCDFSTFMESSLVLQFQVVNGKIVSPALKLTEIGSQIFPLNCTE